MAQLFPRTANTFARASIFCAITAPILLIGIGSGITRSSANTKVDLPLDQPVPFSHEHHVNELGIDCRYCHTGVETSANAGVPPTYTCMSCHSQIWTNSPLLEPIRESLRSGKPIESQEVGVGWNRLNKLPEFVYFNHSIHINRGINCNICHGPVEKMQLTYRSRAFFMAWCLECHRSPQRALYQSDTAKKEGLTPRQQVFDLYWKTQEGESKLSPREQVIADGGDINAYTPTPEELQEGEALVTKLHVKTKQLTDCWTCHR